jgi:late competence protein required for DNA uptake (superfamily II DNA/RNA helicase)
MHSDIETIERMEIIRDLRLGEFDVLVASTCCARAWIFPKSVSCAYWMRIRRAFCAPPRP